MRMKMNKKQILENLFHPGSLAVIGASDQKNKLGYELVRGFVEMGYAGKLYLVNPSMRADIFNLPVYSKLSDVPDEIVLAIIITPPFTLPGLIKECAKKRVQGIILFVTPSDNHQPELLEAIDLATSCGIKIIGPNSMGLHCPSSGLAIWPELPRKNGSVSFISHSGAMVFSFVAGIAAKGIGCSKAVAVGNEWDLNWTDYLEYLGQDDQTEIIAGYIEGVKDGRRFLNIATSISSKKPILCIKGGDSARGKVFAGSHTGAIAGRESIWKAAFAQANIIKVLDFQDMINHVLMFKHLMSRPLGRRIGLISGTGGPTVITTDLCQQYGLDVPELSSSTKKAFIELLPPYGSSCRNPVDLSIAAGVEQSLYSRSIQILNQSPDVDVIVCLHTGDYVGEEVVRRLIEENRQGAKPLVVIMVGATERNDRCVNLLLESGIPACDGQEGAIRSLRSVIKWKEHAR